MRKEDVKGRILSTLKKHLHFDTTHGIKGINATADELMNICHDVWQLACLDQKHKDMDLINNSKTAPSELK